MYTNKKKPTRRSSFFTIVFSIVIVIILSFLSAYERNELKFNIGKNYYFLSRSFIADARSIEKMYRNLTYVGPIELLYDKKPNMPVSEYVARYLKYPSVNKALLRDNPTNDNGVWFFNEKHFFANVGTSAADPTMLVTGINDKACKSINYISSGKRVILSANINDYDSTSINHYSQRNSNTFINISSLPDFRHVYYGCVSTNIPNNNFYFLVLEAK